MTIETPSELIDAFGGTGKTAAIFGVLPSAVSNWRSANRFPDRLHHRVWTEARARRIDIPADFFDPHSETVVHASSHAAAPEDLTNG